MKNKYGNECYYIRTTAIRGTHDPDLGFMVLPDAKELYVSSLLAVEASKDKKRWEDILSLAGKAFHKGFNKKKR